MAQFKLAAEVSHVSLPHAELDVKDGKINLSKVPKALRRDVEFELREVFPEDPALEAEESEVEEGDKPEEGSE